ncbi:MAG TPA: hypothetical protein VMV23_07650 [Candidatus Nanopelagicaceae bacterium]|nr:hypothetical protein [Candidatus Nanopelagicaceae bacterium]
MPLETDGRSRVKGTKPPSLYSAGLKMWRAQTHLNILRDQLAALTEGDVYSFEVKIDADGLNHTYYSSHPARVPDSIVVVLGDCIHNLRSVLDHLACQLVRASGQEPGNVAFPIQHEKTAVDPCTGIERPTLALPVRDDIRDSLDSMQPYHGTDIGRRLNWLNGLDIIDKHRDQLVVATAVGSAKTRVYDIDNPDVGRYPLGRVTKIWPEPLKHGKPCLRLTYPAPQLEANPYTKVAVKVRFGNPGPAKGQHILTVLEDLVKLVRDDIVGAFAPMIGVVSGDWPPGDLVTLRWNRRAAIQHHRDLSWFPGDGMWLPPEEQARRHPESVRPYLRSEPPHGTESP